MSHDKAALVTSFLALIVALLVGGGCGGAGNAVRAPDTPLTLTPPAPPTPSTKPDAPGRPTDVAVWAHVAQPDALFDLLGLASSSSSSSQAFAAEIGPYLEAIDLRQPVDGVLLSSGDHVRDLEPAFRAHFRDSRALIRVLEREFRLREEGDRIYARSKRGGDGAGAEDDEKGKDEFACEIARGSDVAVCGSPKGVDAVARWLLPGPTPSTVPSSAIARLIVFSEPVRELALDMFDGERKRRGRKHPRGDHDRGGESPSAAGDLAAFLSDCDRLAVELSVDPSSKQLTLEGLLKLKSTDSRIARELVASPNDTKGAAPPDAFTRLTQDTAMSVYLPGGGSLPKWVREMLKHTYEGSTRDAAKRDAAAKAIGDVFAGPSMLGLGVRVDRAKTALATARTARTAKDIERGLRALDDALESQLVFSLSTPIAPLEGAFRDVHASAPPLTGSASTFGGGPAPAKYVLRAAPRSAGLPKGSFVVEQRSLDWLRFTPPPSTGNAPAGAPATPVKVVYTLFAERDATTTIGASCLVEEMCVETVKKALTPNTLVTTKTSLVSPATEPLFQQKGLVAGGYIPSSIEISPMTRMGIRSYMPGTPLPTDALANIERDLGVPRVHVPFALTLTKDAGSGALLKVEMRGPRDDFRSVFDPHGGAFSSSWVLIPLVVAAFAGG